MATLTLTPRLKSTPLCPGDGIVGCDYLLAGNKLYFSETDGEIDEFNFSTRKHTFGFGKGYKKLQDIKISRDGLHAYVTEDEGNLLRVNLKSPNRANAALISTGMKNPRQIFLDEARGLAYVIESGLQGRLLRIHLPSVLKPIFPPLLNPATNHYPVARAFFGGMGLLLSADRQFAYVSQEMAFPMKVGGMVLRVHLNTGNKDVLVQGLKKPGFLTWIGDGEHTIAVTEHGANDVVLIDLTKAPVTHTVLGDVATGPTGLCLVGTDLYIASTNEIDKLALTPYNAKYPVLMGIGYVPEDHIKDGFATTAADYFFHVVDAVFGGSLPIMVNHEYARNKGAGYYKLFVKDASDPAALYKEVPTVQYWDYLLDPATGTFKLTANPRTPGEYYEVRRAGDVWLNEWLGAFLNSTALANGKYSILVRLFDTNTVGNHALGESSVDVVIDNGWPTAHVDTILHNNNPIETCAVESLSTGDDWTFGLTAVDPEMHFKSWGLTAMWGDNKSEAIVSGEYDPTAHPDHLWAGLAEPDTVPTTGAWHATRANDPTSINCAHTFYLGVWDRVINGWDYLHYNWATKSITIIP